MPSNTMKISQLLAVLAEQMTRFGDLDVVIPHMLDNTAYAVTQPEVRPEASLPWLEFARPVLVLHYSAPYVASPEPETGWSYRLGDAPVSADLQNPVVVKVMKRIGGEDTGFRDADGQWYVYEGGTRPWAIVPGGILSWRPL